VNCSASGKKRGGDNHVVKAQGLFGFTILLRPLFFQYFILSSIIQFIKKVNIGAGLAIGWLTEYQSATNQYQQ